MRDNKLQLKWNAILLRHGLPEEVSPSVGPPGNSFNPEVSSDFLPDPSPSPETSLILSEIRIQSLRDPLVSALEIAKSKLPPHLVAVLALRCIAGLSQVEIATVLHIDQSTVCRWERKALAILSP